MRRIRFALLVLVAVPWTARLALATVPGEREAPARWLLTGAINDPRDRQSATLLADGRVLICGGTSPQPGTVRLVPSCEVWSPETERWTPAGSLAYPRASMASVRLADGRVAFVGGTDYGVPGSAVEARSAIDLWDPRHNDATTAGTLPFSAERPQAVLQPDGRLFVTDDGPESERLRAAIWNPADNKSKLEEAPPGAGRTAALLVDGRGTLTLVRSRPDCHQISIWRRRPGEAWVLAHVDDVPSCGKGAFMLDEHRIVHWSSYNETGPSYAMVWNFSSGESETLTMPDAADQLFVVSLGGGRLLSVGKTGSHLYVPGAGWRATGWRGEVDASGTFTPLQDGRVLMLSMLRSRVWTPSAYSTNRPCVFFAGLLEEAVRQGTFPAELPTQENVGSACWSAIATDPNLSASHALRTLAQRPPEEGGAAGMALICAIRPRWAVDLMIRGLRPNMFNDPRACLTGLAESDQPAARQAVDAYVQDCQRGDRSLDVLASAAASSEGLRVRSADVLVSAWDRRRSGSGFDSLRPIVCRSPVPTKAAAICRKAEVRQEATWDEAPRHRRKQLITGAAVAIGAGLAIGGTLNRNNDVGRAIAIAAGTLGVSAPFTAALLNDHNGPYTEFDEIFIGSTLGTSAALGLTGAALATGNPGASRAAISIVGGTLFTMIHLAAVWLF